MSVIIGATIVSIVMVVAGGIMSLVADMPKLSARVADILDTVGAGLMVDDAILCIPVSTLANVVM